MNRRASLQRGRSPATSSRTAWRAARGAAQFAQLRAVLTHLPRGRLATVAVLGNHDCGPGWGDARVAAAVQAELERAGAVVLRNAAHVVAPGGRTVYVNRGVGHTLPVRFNVRPEATLFTLRAG